MIDLFVISFKAHNDYIIPRIPNGINQLYYMYTNGFIADIINESDNIEQLIWKLLHLKQETETKRKPTSLFFKKTKYELMAIDHALEIAYSLKKRFEGGLNV